MAGTTGQGGESGSGCLMLIVGVIVLAVIGFVLEHWEFFLGTALVVGALAVVGFVGRSVYQGTVGAKQVAEAAAEKTRKARAAELETARQAGRRDMRTAWLAWQVRPGAAPKAARSADTVAGALGVVPKADWDLAELRKHGRALWAQRGGTPGHHLLPEVEARLDRVAAMISDRTDEEFDTSSGQTDDHYLYHQDREVRAAYLEGGAEAVERIMDTITAARVQAREDAAAKAAADTLARQRNAALRAMRETQQSTAARDAHAAWDAEAKRLEH